MEKKLRFKNIIPILLVIVVIISYILYNNYKPNGKAVINKPSSEETSQNTAKTEQDKNQTENNATIGDGKEQSENDNSKVSEGKEGDQESTNKDKEDEITAFLQEVSFGSTVEINVNNNLSNNYKYYQFYVGNKAISKVESIEKNNTILYPSQESGAEVQLKVFDENKKLIKTLDIRLKAK